MTCPRRCPASKVSRTKRIFKIVSGCLAIIILTALILFYFAGPFCQGFLTRHTIIKALDGATSVRVVEHSDRYGYRPDQAAFQQYQEVVFASQTLTPSQVQAFRDSIPFRSDYGSTMGLACNYQQHHRVKIDQANGEIFVFGICFECGQINLNNNGPRIMPTGWYSSLERFITSLGLHPEGPFGN